MAPLSQVQICTRPIPLSQSLTEPSRYGLLFGTAYLSSAHLYCSHKRDTLPAMVTHEFKAPKRFIPGAWLRNYTMNMRYVELSHQCGICGEVFKSELDERCVACKAARKPQPRMTHRTDLIL